MAVEVISLTDGGVRGRQSRSNGSLAEALDEQELQEVLLDTAPGPDLNEDRASRRLQWRDAVKRRLLGVFDILAVTVTMLIVQGSVGKHHALLLASALPLVVVLFKIAGLYDRDDLRLVQSTLDEVPTMIQLTALFALGVAILKWLFGGTLGGERIAELWLCAFVAIVAGRIAARTLASRIARPERCLVIGDPGRAHRIRERVAASPAWAEVVASVELTTEDLESAESSTAILQIVSELEVDRIVVAPATGDDGADIVALIRWAKAVGVRVSVLPRMFEVVGSAVVIDVIDGMTMLGVRRFGLSDSSRLLKRAFDLCGAALGLLLVGPLMALIALAIRLDSPGPVFFRQTRVGRDGRHFSILKFRSMRTDAESLKHALLAQNEAGPGLFKIAADPRVTRVGRILRRTSLDELPQLLNVLRGEMSLVGPRPLVIDEDALVMGMDRQRLHLTPGMTGPWQVLGTRVPMQEMVGIDYLYVTSWSLWMDFKILLRTLRHVVNRGNT
ncbi:MAG: exopolysaccharide biosynthesis polyprenyl glycosylphosphotransferase [Solirubrobacterales bacterium]|nr:exopolysaccharide biosynthesis polyprenyl glycosylphosphotransferase [Solirubrobacterales bacterium]